MSRRVELWCYGIVIVGASVLLVGEVIDGHLVKSLLLAAILVVNAWTFVRLRTPTSPA